MRHFHAICVKITRQRPFIGPKTSIFPPNGHWHLLCYTRGKNCGRVAVKRDERHMKTLLRRVSTGLYFRGPDQWTENPAEAHNFKMIDRALEFVERWHLRDMELAFAFDDPEEVTRVPIDKMELRYSEG
jgi:hypothetical protein